MEMLPWAAAATVAVLLILTVMAWRSPPDERQGAKRILLNRLLRPDWHDDGR